MKERGSSPTRKVIKLVFSFIILFLPVSTVYAQWKAVSPPDPELSLNAVQLVSGEEAGTAPAHGGPIVGAGVYKWNTIYSSKVTVSGLASESDKTYGDCTLYDNGTFNCYEDDHGIDRNYTGTYVHIGTTGYKIQFILDSNGLQEYRDMLTGWAEDLAYEEGVQISNLSFSFTTVMTSQVKISKKSGIPGKAKVTIKGKVSADLDGKYTTKSFSFSSKITFQDALQHYALTVQKSGNGIGTVTSSPTGINCGSACSGTCNAGTIVTLKATVGKGSTFSGWSGCDSTRGKTCTVAMNQNRPVTAFFNSPQTQPSPNAPSNLKASATSSSSISLSWTDNASNESGFKVERAPGGTTSFVEMAILGANVTSYLNTGLSASTSYSYRVRAYNSAGNSAYSNTATVPTQPIQAQTPTISAPSTSTGSFSVSVSYSWPPLSSNMDRYELEESTTSSSSGFKNIQTVYANVSPYVFSLTRQPGTYYFRARVLVGASPNHDFSPYSSVVQVVVTAPTRSITLQNNMSTSLNLHEIVQIKVAPTEAGVFMKNDLLTTDSASGCRSLPGESIISGSSRTFNITIGNDYWVFIGIGIWDMDNFLCSWSSPWFKRTFFTDTNFNIHYVWRTVHVQGHSSGNMVWTISGSYLNGTLAVYPQGGSPIYFNVTPNNPIP